MGLLANFDSPSHKLYCVFKRCSAVVNIVNGLDCLIILNCNWCLLLAEITTFRSLLYVPLKQSGPPVLGPKLSRALFSRYLQVKGFVFIKCYWCFYECVCIYIYMCVCI